MSWGNAWGTRAWGGGAPISTPSTVLTANTLHAVDHVVSAQPAINLVAGTLHDSAHIVTATPPALAINAGTLHITVHAVSASILVNPTVNTLHVRVHIAAVPLLAGSLHTHANVVSVTGVTTGAASIPIVVPLNGNSPPYNPQFLTTVDATPQFDAALLDSDLNGAGPVPRFAGASATFSMHELGGAQLFEHAAVFDDPTSGRVHYQVRADELSVQGKYLARFHVTYAEGGLNQAFPADRYIEIIVQ